jgi:hypothetical protein
MWNEPIDTDSSGDDTTDSEGGQEDEHPTREEQIEAAQTDQHPQREAQLETVQADQRVATQELPAEENTHTEHPKSPDQEEKQTRSRDTARPADTKTKKKVEITTPQTDKEITRKLWKDTQDSADKLFFIRQHETGRDLAEWHLIQVDKEATDRRNARRYGKYHERYYIKNETNSEKKKTWECQYWPLLRELLRDGYLGAIIQVNPSRIEKFLEDQPTKYIWYQDTINLADVMIIGPFEFSNQIQHHIPETQWKTLLDKAKDYGVDATDVNRRVPLPQHKATKSKKRKR